MMISKTGNKNRAFTLIEVMFTTVIFSLATVLIYETYFRSLDLLNYCNDYFKVVSWVDDKMWQAQNELTRFNTMSKALKDDVLNLDNKRFTWKLSYSETGGVPYLYRIESTISWSEGRKNVAISRMAYAVYEEEE